MGVWVRCGLLPAVLAVLCGAQQARAEWQHFGVGDGLAGYEVNAILEDGAGHLWFGCGVQKSRGGGVSSYDGVSWKTFTTTDGLADNSVYAIVEDRSGQLWFGTGGERGADGERQDLGRGASRFDGVSWRTFTTADGLAGNSVYAIIEDSSGNLWFGTYDGASRYDGEGWSTFTTAEGLADNRVDAICQDRSGNLWFGTRSGISRYDGAGWSTFTTADGLADNWVEAICQDRSGNIWAGTRGGISRYDGTSWRTFALGPPWENRVKTIFEDRRGHLWFGTWSNGVRCYDGERWRSFTTADGLATNSVLAITEDNSGNLWFGSSDWGGGVDRYDRSNWRTYTTADGLASNGVNAILEDRLGNLWFGTGEGVSRYDGVNWRTLTASDGLAGNAVYSIAVGDSTSLWFGTREGASRYDGGGWSTFTTGDGLAGSEVISIAVDRRGRLWFGTFNGVSRYDGDDWRTFTTADGLASNCVYSILEDRSGNLWFGTVDGLSRYDGDDWTTFTTADGLASNIVHAILEDKRGGLWVATGGELGAGGVSAYDGQHWRTFTTADGLAGNIAGSLAEDSAGNIWVGIWDGGASRYDGVSWLTFTTADGLAFDAVSAIVEDRCGTMWFGTAGATAYEPDRVPPQTVIVSRPPPLSTGTSQGISFAAAYRETRSIAFSYSFDGSVWSAWSPSNVWSGTSLSDGTHMFAVKARDRVGNVDSSPAVCRFEIDATSPTPVIYSPSFNQVVRDSIVIQGTAADFRFKSYLVEVRSAESGSWRSLADSSSPVTRNVLAGWSTSTVPDGPYQIRLSVVDSLGLTGTALVEVVVDNEAPWAKETTPAVVSTVTGGDVYTTGNEVHLYFPPHAFVEDAVVTIQPTPADSVPETLSAEAVRLVPGYQISWGDANLGKRATLEFSLAGVDSAAITGNLALYHSSDGETWQRVGGTVDGARSRISLAVSEQGWYALFADAGEGHGGLALSPLSLTPRVFSPTGGFADRQVGIGFTIGRAGPVSVKVYNRAGRLVREVLAGGFLEAGANLLRWDGKNNGGVTVADGLYVVTVEALGQKQTATIAVVK